MFLIPFVSVLIPTLLGQRYGQYRKKISEQVQHAPVGSVVGAAFGLLAFMLAITFQIAGKGVLKINIELRDENYPGSKYDLTYIQGRVCPPVTIFRLLSVLLRC